MKNEDKPESNILAGLRGVIPLKRIDYGAASSNLLSAAPRFDTIRLFSRPWSAETQAFRRPAAKQPHRLYLPDHFCQTCAFA